MALESAEAAAQGQHPIKLSRYRSVRQAASRQRQQDANAVVPPVPSVSNKAAMPPTPSSAVSRSRSRYRRVKPVATPSAPPPLPSLAGNADGRHHPGGLDHQTGGSGSSASREKRSGSGTHAEGRTSEADELIAKHRQDAMDRLTGARSSSTRSRSSSRRPATRARDERRAPEDRQAHAHAHAQRKEEAYPRKEAEEHANGHSFPATTEAKQQLSFKERVELAGTKGTDHKAITKHGGPGANLIEVGGGGIGPGVDAPVSAINAGDRRVCVQYSDSSILLPVTPSTHAKRLLSSAANFLGSGINPENFIIMESFSQFALERPLRRYEHIRDVMNSWTSDQDNSLIIVPASSEDAIDQLDLKSVPTHPPPETTFYLHYSQRSGKWDKRYVTLRADGQITLSKKESSKEQTNACHLSDFDIYSVAAYSLPRKDKPPKRFSYAIKSQQKASMFLSTEDFIHYFTTNDDGVAKGFYKAVHMWRSWYLVNKLGAGQKKGTEESPVTGSTGPQSPRRHRPMSSELYQIGSFKPLIDLDAFENRLREGAEDPGSSNVGGSTQHMGSRGRSPSVSSPTSDGGIDSNLHTGISNLITMDKAGDEAPFSASGLLGRTYSQRQQKMREREQQDKRTNEEPFFSQGLIHSKFCAPSSSQGPDRNPRSASNSRSNTMRSMQGPDPSGLRRSASQKQKPLVDLTPQYKEPPQHSHKGHGVKVEPGVALIDAATGRDPPPGGVVIPPATTWRRPRALSPPVPQLQIQPNTGNDFRTRQFSNATRDGQSPHLYQRQHFHSAAGGTRSDQERSPETPFTPDSLLARSGLSFAERGIPKGHGVATGDRNAKKPMLDMSEMNPFAEGSLLRDLKA
ncbi:hypothetical protein MAP00_001755 [Monascus purpureus]|nr:hypothetical protein MAP00_001755 [Monascus purpureus]